MPFFFFLSFHSFHTTLIRKCSGLIFKPVIRILYISQIAISPFSFLQTSISYIPKQWNKLGSLPYGRILLYILLSVTVLEFYCLVIVVVFFQTQLLLWAISCMRNHKVWNRKQTEWISNVRTQHVWESGLRYIST